MPTNERTTPTANKDVLTIRTIEMPTEDVLTVEMGTTTCHSCGLPFPDEGSTDPSPKPGVRAMGQWRVGHARLLGGNDVKECVLDAFGDFAGWVKIGADGRRSKPALNGKCNCA